jgi:hypothetical protein
MTIIQSNKDSQLYIEVTDGPHVITAGTLSGGAIKGGGAPDLVNKIRLLGDTIGQTCAELVESAQKKLDKMKPAELSVEFGISLGGELGVPFVTKGTGEATFTVTATWKMGPEVPVVAQLKPAVP